MRRKNYKKAVLILEDLSIFWGTGIGYPCSVSGEVVFNTGMVGYTESLTDPSYFGQILVQTYPLIGNYGVPSYNITDKFGLPLHFESEKIQVRGYVVSSLSENFSHWASKMSLDEWLFKQKIPGIEGIDTRELTKKLRKKGAMLGILKVGVKDIDKNRIKSEIKKIKDPNRKNLVKEVSIDKIEYYKTLNKNSPTIVLIDCGVKYGILRNLLNKGVNIVRVPYDYPAEKILNFNPSGVVISNGPGNPKNCPETIETIKKLLETEIPILGICLGLQLLVLAAGGDTYKLKFGHRGQNHPCLDLKLKKCYITSQNHGFAVKNLEKTGFEINLININDKTIEGITHKKKSVFATQFHPEASPGPYETEFFFDQFLEKVAKCQN